MADKGEAAVAERSATLEDLKITLKEKIELGEVVRIEAAAGNVLDSYQHNPRWTRCERRPGRDRWRKRRPRP